MTRRKLAILGCGGHAKCVAEIALLNGWEIACFLDDSLGKDPRDALMGIHIKRGTNALSELGPSGIDCVAIAIGDCDVRFEKIRAAELFGLELPSLVHPSAAVSPRAHVSSAVVISAGSVVQIDASIGKGSIVNTGATIDHDCTIGETVHLSPGVHLAGNVCIGDRTWIGIGTSVRENVKIGSGAIVGAGSIVLSSIPDDSAAWGTPARIQRTRRGSSWESSSPS